MQLLSVFVVQRVATHYRGPCTFPFDRLETAPIGHIVEKTLLCIADVIALHDTW